MSGNITLEELSDGLKTYLTGLGLTEEHVNQAITLATGDKEQLQTNNKDTLVSAINEVFQSGVNVKDNMVQAINSKKTVSDVSNSDTWDTITQRVNDIKEGSGNATIGDVLAGKTFTNNDGIEYTGTMVNRGGAQTVTPGTAAKTLSSGYYSGNITVKGDANLVAANIVSGKSIFGVAGNASVASLGGKRWASGTTTCVKISSFYYTSITGLNFTPSFVMAYWSYGGTPVMSLYWKTQEVKIATDQYGNVFKNSSLSEITISSNGFNLYMVNLSSAATSYWIAFE